MAAVTFKPDLDVQQLGREQLLDAWPMLELAGAERLPSWWEHEARALLRAGGGVLVVRRSDGLVQGLATYERVDRPRAKRILAVGRLITFELSLRKPVRKALLRALDRIALGLGCSSVALPLDAPRSD